jgi:hypothetical protein
MSFDPAGGASFILAPQVGQSRAVGQGARRLIFPTMSGLVRAWLKLRRGSKVCFSSVMPPILPFNASHRLAWWMAPGVNGQPLTHFGTPRR